MSGSKRRARGEGTYQQLPSGLWRNIVKVADVRTAGPAAPTRQEARANTLKKLGEKPEELRLSQSFTTLARSWTSSRRKRLSPTTVETETYWADQLESEPIGKCPVSELTERKLKAWLESHKWASSTARNRARWANSMLEWAGAEARCPVPAKRDHRRRPLSPAERELLLARLEEAPDEIRIGAMLCWFAGLRRSEACGLRHEDREGDGVRVSRVVLQTTGKLTVRRKGKSAASLAWVPLPPALRSIVGDGEGYVLGSDRPLSPKKLSHGLRDLCAGTILEGVPHMGSHALRRTYGMTLLESGADVATAARAMRHDPQTLLREYARSREDLLKTAVERAFPAQ